MISSIHNEFIKQLNRLKDRKNRNVEKLFLVEGEHMVNEALEHGICKQIITSIPHYTASVPITFVNDEVMKKLSDVSTPPGVIAVCHQSHSQIKGPKILLLDHLQDPGNLGTIIRSAVAFGFTTIVADGGVDLYHPKVIRATQGGVFKVAFLEQPLSDFIKENPAYHYVSSVVSGNFELSKSKNEYEQLAIIIGNEAHGISKEVLALSDEYVTIPMRQTESLNAGVAASILMYHYNN